MAPEREAALVAGPEAEAVAVAAAALRAAGVRAAGFVGEDGDAARQMARELLGEGAPVVRLTP